MMGLLEKDLRLILIRKSTLVIYLVIGIVFTWQFSGSVSGAYLTMMATMLALSTLSYDDSDNCMQFLLTLPCTRKQYVIEKYLFVYGFSFIAGLVGIIIILVANLINRTPVETDLLIEAMASELPILVITGGITIPLYLKYGAEKTRIVLMALIGIAFILGYMLSKMADAEFTLKSLANTLNSMNPFVLLLVLIAVLAVLTVVSGLVSMKIVGNKEY